MMTVVDVIGGTDHATPVIGTAAGAATLTDGQDVDIDTQAGGTGTGTGTVTGDAAADFQEAIHASHKPRPWANIKR